MEGLGGGEGGSGILKNTRQISIESHSKKSIVVVEVVIGVVLVVEVHVIVVDPRIRPLKVG